ncbi:MAG: glutamate formimidoyltransferase [Vicinamibacterales bacterium]
MIEVVPNVSEGRRPEIVHALRTAVASVPGASLLDCSSDPSHNRSVFTLVGEADALHGAILRLVDVAVRHIDLRTPNRGAHPRMGVVDVVPFIPLEGAVMADCVTLARETARSIADTFGVPTYLYEEAATRPERRRLESIRRGEFEGLAARMGTAEWQPDYGPSVPHASAGATAVGARKALIAFNVDLESATLDDARHIAAVVRESSGGLRAVKALGLWLPHRDCAQVSMNLTDFTATSVAVAFDAVVEAAKARGVGVRESELVGLIPAAALAGTTSEHLKLAGFDASRILEERIKQMTKSALPLRTPRETENTENRAK